LSRCRVDGSRWSFIQKIYRGDDAEAAKITVDGAWIDMEKRKLTVPPKDFNRRFLEQLPKTENFSLEPASGV
jgi:acyl-CoA thioester hydrolase